MLKCSGKGRAILSISAKVIYFYFFLSMCICVSEHGFMHVGAGAQSQEEGAGRPGVGVMGGCELSKVSAELRSSAGAACTCTTKTSLRSMLLSLLCI